MRSHFFGRIVVTASFISSCLLPFVLSVEGFAADFVPREVIVMFKWETDLSQARLLLDSEDFEVRRSIFCPLSVYLVDVVNPNLSEEDAVDTLMTLGFVEKAHVNFVLYPTVVPNDDQFPDQKNLSQPSDADIDASEAWDWATGSSSLYGGDIVVAVIDNGFNRDHPELIDRQWINTAEFNGLEGVDDDSNGAIDDIRGYQMYEPDTGSAFIYCEREGEYGEQWWGDHGTWVAGLLAASTNNDTMIAAPNWGCKLLLVSMCMDPITGGFTFDMVDSALSYVGATKQRWIETQGRLGANIVAVNMSLSMDYVRCTTTTLDSTIQVLGNRGILSIAAAPNRGMDVDVMHATPADCPSDHLISVTSCDSTDSRYTEPYPAAWGPISIDLWAPGKNVWTLDHRGWTRNDLTGTSLACPQVASAVALAYSVPNPAFHEFYDVNMSAAVLAVRSAILSGVDRIPRLEPYCSSGGRLNLGAPLVKMCNYYHDNGHTFTSTTIEATAPSSAPNLARGKGLHAVFDNGTDLIYSWRMGGNHWRHYRLTSSRSSGEQPSIASGEEGITGTVPTISHIYTSWLAGSGEVCVLQHVIHGDYVFPLDEGCYEEWRMARLSDTALTGQNVTVTAPVVVKENNTIPAVVVGVSGGTSPGVHVWRAPDVSWHDFESWGHTVVTGSIGQNVTSASASTWNDSDELHVVWTTDNDEVHFQKGTVSGTTYAWDAASHEVLSEGWAGASGLINVTYGYSPRIHGGFCAWEGTDVSTGRQNIYLAQGSLDSGQIDWGEPYSLYSGYECVNFRAPQLHAYDDGGFILPIAGHCRMGLVFERQHVDETTTRIQCTGLRVNEQNPTWPGGWSWIPPVNRLPGRYPSIIESGDNGGYELLYAEDGTSPVAMRFDYVALTYDLDPPVLPVDGDTVRTSVTWYAPLVLDRPVVIEDGGHLTFRAAPRPCMDPTVISMWSNVNFKVQSGGRLEIRGDVDTVITITAQYGGQTWSGIKVEEGGSLYMEYVNMFDTDSFCVSAEQPYDGENEIPLHIKNCYLDGKKLVEGAQALRIIGTPDRVMVVEDSRIDSLAAGATALYLYDCRVQFENDTIRSSHRIFDEELKDSVQINAWGNMFLQNVTGMFTGCIFQGRTSFHGILFHGEVNTPVFRCCVFEDVAPLDWEEQYHATLFAMKGSSPIFGYDDDDKLANVIADSSIALMYMCGCELLPIIDALGGQGPGGVNDWYQNAETYNLYWDEYDGDPYRARQQFWLPERDFYPQGWFDLEDMSEDPWGLCGSGQGLYAASPSERNDREHGRPSAGNLDDLQADRALFRTGLNYEIAEQYADAQAAFHTLATTSLNSELRWLAITHILSTERHLNAPQTAWIPALIDSARQLQSQDTSAWLHAKRLLAAYHTDQEEYTQAVAICTSLLDSGLTFNDSILVALDLVGIQMLEASESGGGTLDSDLPGSVPAGLRVASVEQGVRKQRDLLSLYGTGANAGRREAIPKSYKLYQNYPNPFNPNTEIRFDLPEAVKVQLKIFNILGQEVTTLMDAVRPAGAHRVMWDSKSGSGAQVASGVYVYQIKAGGFVDSKKMVMIR